MDATFSHVIGIIGLSVKLPSKLMAKPEFVDEVINDIFRTGGHRDGSGKCKIQRHCAKRHLRNLEDRDVPLKSEGDAE